MGKEKGWRNTENRFSSDPISSGIGEAVALSSFLGIWADTFTIESSFSACLDDFY